MVPKGGGHVETGGGTAGPSVVGNASGNRRNGIYGGKSGGRHPDPSFLPDLLSTLRNVGFEFLPARPGQSVLRRWTAGT